MCENTIYYGYTKADNIDGKFIVQHVIKGRNYQVQNQKIAVVQWMVSTLQTPTTFSNPPSIDNRAKLSDN